MLQPSFQSESPWSAAVQLHMDVLERHQLLYGLHHDFCAFSSVRPPCNHDATSSRQPETPGMRGTGGGVGWPVMGFPWTPSGGSTWDWIVDLSNRWNGQLGKRFALTDQWNYRRGGNFIDRCATAGENSGKLAIINFLVITFKLQQRTERIPKREMFIQQLK